MLHRCVLCSMLKKINCIDHLLDKCDYAMMKKKTHASCDYCDLYSSIKSTLKIHKELLKSAEYMFRK